MTKSKTNQIKYKLPFKRLKTILTTEQPTSHLDFSSRPLKSHTCRSRHLRNKTSRPNLESIFISLYEQSIAENLHWLKHIYMQKYNTTKLQTSKHKPLCLHDTQHLSLKYLLNHKQFQQLPHHEHSFFSLNCPGNCLG